MNDDLNFLINFYANLKIKQIKKNAFRDERVEAVLIVDQWVNENIAKISENIDFKKLQEVIDNKKFYIKQFVEESDLKKEALSKIALIKKLSVYRGERWYDTSETDIKKTSSKYNQLGQAVSGLLMAITIPGATGISEMTNSLVTKFQELDGVTKVAIWSTPMVLGLMIDAFKKLK